MVSTGFPERLYVVLRLYYHEVYVERLGAKTAHCFHHHHTEGEIGHETAIHDIQVEPVRFTFVDAFHFFRQAGEVGCEQGGGNQVPLSGHIEQSWELAPMYGSTKIKKTGQDC
jgi:hypothetical protein